MSNQISAVVFDKDGVIFNTEALYGEALLEAAQTCSLKLPSDLLQKMTGLNAKKTRILINEVLTGQMDGDEFIFEHWLPRFEYKAENGELTLCEGVESLIETLSENYPLALVTSDDQEHVLYSFNATRPDLLHYFSVIVTVDDVENPKPHPEPYERASVLLGFEPANLLVLEDSNYGIKSALDAGTQVLIYAANKRDNLEKELADRALAVIKSHAEVLNYLTL